MHITASRYGGNFDVELLWCVALGGGTNLSWRFVIRSRPTTYRMV